MLHIKILNMHFYYNAFYSILCFYRYILTINSTVMSRCLISNLTGFFFCSVNMLIFSIVVLTQLGCHVIILHLNDITYQQLDPPSPPPPPPHTHSIKRKKTMKAHVIAGMFSSASKVDKPKSLLHQCYSYLISIRCNGSYLPCSDRSLFLYGLVLLQASSQHCYLLILFSFFYNPK